ncbi:MAG: DNA methyltransferase [Candidatus Thermoplasmatota archaeon]|nr:DNA methyltransferase [Candidatus Thermoplasmatota archaeon]MCL5789757.1 DNA methyltransferase [Candidatus Thermoplasmatota archaeon]
MPREGRRKSKQKGYGVQMGSNYIVEALLEALSLDDRNSFRAKIRDVSRKVDGIPFPLSYGRSPYSYLKDDLRQILESETLERGKYYARRLVKSLTESRTNGINDINLNRWKEYGEILTDSLWIFDRRDSSGSHLGWYWGNFVPQIPRQVILRFTKMGDWVLDPFSGSGTTIIESIRLGRNSIGVEINQTTLKKAVSLIRTEPNSLGAKYLVEPGDSTKTDFSRLCRRAGAGKVQLIIMHPPYFDIIRFGKKKGDLSGSKSMEEFLEGFGRVVDNTYPVLQDGRFLVMVVGDKYQNGEWIPLGFYAMEIVMKRGYTLTGIVVKNFEDTRAKRENKELWRYRALAGGFYVFKHEYIFIFKKRAKKGSGADRV